MNEMGLVIKRGQMTNIGKKRRGKRGKKWSSYENTWQTIFNPEVRIFFVNSMLLSILSST